MTWLLILSTLVVGLGVGGWLGHAIGKASAIDRFRRPPVRRKIVTGY